MSGTWQVKAIDNFSAPGEGDVIDIGVCKTKEQGIARAQRHVRESLEEAASGAVSVADLMRRFFSFGETTIVYSLDSDENASFSGSDYAHSIAQEVFQDSQRTEIDPLLRAAYRATHYLVALPSGESLIEVGKSSSPVDAWLKEIGKRSALFLTAWNPMSRPQSPEANAIRHADLVEMASDGEFPFVDAVGRSPDGDWSETSLLIAGVTVSEADRWARVFEQAGYVWIDLGEPASLRVRTTRDTWVEEADLA